MTNQEKSSTGWKPYLRTPETFEAFGLPLVASPIQIPMDRTSAMVEIMFGDAVIETKTCDAVDDDDPLQCIDYDLNLVDRDAVDDDPEASLTGESWVHEESFHLAIINYQITN